MLALNDGAGGFVVAETETDDIRNTTGRFPLATADFDGDGNADLALTVRGQNWFTMADNSGTPVDEAHGFEPHHDQHVYFRKMENPEDQLKPFSPLVTCAYDK